MARTGAGTLRFLVVRGLSTAAAAAVLISTVATGISSAAATCAFEGGIMRIALDAGGAATVSVGAAGEVLVDGVVCGTATLVEATAVEIAGGQGGEQVTIDLRGGPFVAPDGRRIAFSINLGAGADLLTVVGTAARDVILRARSGMTLRDDSTVPDVALVGIDETLLVGGGGNDKLGAAGPRSPARRLLLQGDIGNDLLVGGRGQDSLFGGAGTDRLEGGFGPDIGDGGPGNDLLVGSYGRDRLRGTSGSDSISGGPDSDRIAAGDGDDAAVGGPGGDALLGGRGGDELEGKEDGDRVVGGPGADVAAGQTGRDKVFGKSEPDRLTGGPGEDRVLGGERGDLLFGGDGGDGLLGGDGRDTCYQGGGGGFRSSCEKPGSKRPFPLTRAKRTLVVNQNLKEVHAHVPDDIYPASGDQQRSQELWNFARRLSNILTQAPDVLLLQEVSGPAALKTARYLTARFRMRYRAVVRPEKSLWVRVLVRNGNYYGVDVYKKNTAIVINARTTDFRRGGYRSTPQLERDRTDGIRTIQYQAHALLREERTGIKMSAMSIHFNGNPFFPSPEQARIRRTHWSKVVAAFARRRYPGVTSRMIAGEFCQRRCQRGGLETIGCETNRFWRILTGDFRYRDAVFVANRTSNEDLAEQATSRAGKPMRIDYIFARPGVVRASRDLGYTADKGDRNFISDHRGNYALMEIRR